MKIGRIKEIVNVGTFFNFTQGGSLTLVGYCAAKPKLKSTRTGNNMAVLVVYTRDYVGNNYISQPHQCLVFGKKAQIIVRKADKGKYVYIRGMIRSQRVGEGGDSHYYTSVIVEDFQFTPVQSMLALKDTIREILNKEDIFCCEQLEFFREWISKSLFKNLGFLNCQ